MLYHIFISSSFFSSFFYSNPNALPTRPIKNYQKMVSVQKKMCERCKELSKQCDMVLNLGQYYIHNVFFECCTSLLTYILTFFLFSIEELNTLYKNEIVRYIIFQRKRKQPQLTFNAHKTMYALSHF